MIHRHRLRLSTAVVNLFGSGGLRAAWLRASGKLYPMLAVEVCSKRDTEQKHRTTPLSFLRHRSLQALAGSCRGGTMRFSYVLSGLVILASLHISSGEHSL